MLRAFGDLTPEEMKAWSQNLGHADVLTTFTSYGQVPTHRQGELIRGMGQRQKESEGVAQKLHARALAVGDGKEAAVLVTVDVIGVPATVTEEVAARLLKKVGLPRQRLTVCATHTHAT